MRFRAGSAAVLSGLILAACAPASPGSTDGSSARVTGEPIPSIREPSPTPGAPSSLDPSPEQGPSGSVVPYDEGLLSILPADVGGVALAPDADTAATMGADDDLGRVARGLAAAIAFDPATDQFAVAAVIQLEPGILDDAFFRDWRDSYDEGACSQAGGVSGHAQAEIGGRTTYIGSCAGGLRTYHVALDASDIVVSVSALGDERLGEEVIAGLADDASLGAADQPRNGPRLRWRTGRKPTLTRMSSISSR
jgi:hypothetical protein